jgi:hypothetical protein
MVHVDFFLSGHSIKQWESRKVISYKSVAIRLHVSGYIEVTLSQTASGKLLFWLLLFPYHYIIWSLIITELTNEMKAFLLSSCCFLYFIPCALAKADIVSREFSMESSLDDKLSQINLLVYHHSESRTKCSAMCGELCACFGFNHQLERCRIHKSCSQSDMTMDETGWRYYQYDGMFHLIKA